MQQNWGDMDAHYKTIIYWGGDGVEKNEKKMRQLRLVDMLMPGRYNLGLLEGKNERYTGQINI